MTAALAKRAIGVWSRYSGPCSITGTVKVLTNAAEKPVYLLDQASLHVVSATRSIGGSYSFEKIKAGKWIVLGIDDSAQYNAVVVDRVTTQG
jgi:hypothetical protein